MKERDITELLSVSNITDILRSVQPFVIFRIGDSSAGYPVWLGFCESPEEARQLNSIPRCAVSEHQTIEYFELLPYTELRDDERPGCYIQVFEATPEVGTQPDAELLIGRISDHLYLWGVHNPK